MSKWLAVFLACTLGFALAIPAMASPFADVPANHWAYNAVSQLAAYGLVEGFPDGSFKGNEPMTRYQMAMVVARLLVSLDAQIKSEIEAAKQELKAEALATPEKPAEPAKPAEQPVAPAEKAAVERVVEKTIVEKLDKTELEALASKVSDLESAVADVQGKVGAVDEKVTGLEGQVSEVSDKADTAVAKADEAAGKADAAASEAAKAGEAAAAAQADASKALEQVAAVDAEIKDILAKKGVELTGAMQKALDDKAVELIAMVDALKDEFSKELDILGIRVSALEEQLTFVNAKIDDMRSEMDAMKQQIADVDSKASAANEKADALSAKLDEHVASTAASISGLDQKITAVDQKLEGHIATTSAGMAALDQKITAVDTKASTVGEKLDAYIAGHEKVSLSGSSEVKYESTDVRGNANVAWQDPYDIFDDDPADFYSDGKYETGIDFYHELVLNLKADVAPGVVVAAELGAQNNLKGDWSKAFVIDSLSLDVVTPGVLKHVHAGDVKLADTAFQKFTLAPHKLLDSDKNPLYEGAYAELGYGPLAGTLMVARINDAVEGVPDKSVNAEYARYAAGADARVNITDNVKLGASMVRVASDRSSVENEYNISETDKPDQSVYGIYGEAVLAPTMKITGEAAKLQESDDTTANAYSLKGEGAIGNLGLEAKYTLVGENFKPELVNTDDDSADRYVKPNVKEYSLGAKYPVKNILGGTLTLSGGYGISGYEDWNVRKISEGKAGAELVTKLLGFDVTAGVEGKAAKYDAFTFTYTEGSTEKKQSIAGAKTTTLGTSVEAKWGPAIASYEYSRVRYNFAGVADLGVPDTGDWYSTSKAGLGLEFKPIEGVTLTGGYELARTKDFLGVNWDNDESGYEIKDSADATVKAGVDASLKVSEATTLGAGYTYERTADVLSNANNMKTYKSIVKASVEQKLTPKATLTGKVEYGKLDKTDDNGNHQVVSGDHTIALPVANTLAEVTYKYDITTNTTLNLGYTYKKSDPQNTDNDYSVNIISAGLKVTF